jgi:hypothetical protein
MLARLLEDNDATFGNVLVNAIDFEERLNNEETSSAARTLMEEEVKRANVHLQNELDLSALTPESFVKERRLLFGFGAVSLICIVAFWAIFIAIAPRFLLPFADFPPYSTTHFAVDPKGISVDYGENVVLSVNLSGTIPEEATLVLRDRATKEYTESQMFDAGDGHYFQTVEDVRTDFEYFIRIPRGRSKRFDLNVLKLPHIEDVVVTYTYPPYTRRKPETRVLMDEALRGYPGTEVDITLSSNRPLQGGAINVSGKEYSLTLTDTQSVGGNFKISVAGDYFGSVTDVEGFDSDNPIKGKVELLIDGKPEIVIVSPGQDSFAVPDSKIPIEIEMIDDLGITKIALLRNHNGSPDSRKVVYDGDGTEDAVTVTEVLDLEKLGVRPGDVIDYYAVGTDSHPNPPQSVATPAFRLVVISFEEYKEFMQTKMTAADLRDKYDAILEEMQALAKKQDEIMKETKELEDKLAEAGSLSEEEQARLDQLAEEQAALAEATQALAQELEKESKTPGIFDIEEEYKAALAEFAKELQEASELMKAAEAEMSPGGQQGPSSPPSAGSLSSAGESQSEALKKLGKSVQEYQEGIQEAGENLENVMDVISDVETFKYLYTLQKGLERQMRFYADKESPSLDDQVRMKELAELQNQVQLALLKLGESLREHADALDELEEESTNEEVIQ